jgi:hypothetical protein
MISPAKTHCGTEMKTRYKLDYDWKAGMIVEVDDEVLTPQILDEWNTFWGGADERAEAEGGPLVPLLKMMHRVALRESIASNSPLASLREGREEGFPKMDGSAGITIIEFDEFEFDGDDITCEKVST